MGHSVYSLSISVLDRSCPFQGRLLRSAIQAENCEHLTALLCIYILSSGSTSSSALFDNFLDAQDGTLGESGVSIYHISMLEARCVEAVAYATATGMHFDSNGEDMEVGTKAPVAC